MMIYYDDFLNEKMGVMSRVKQETDVFRVSNIVNSFMNEIVKDPLKNYEDFVTIIDTVVNIQYRPIKPETNSTRVRGSAYNGKNIIIECEPVNEHNYLEIKYVIIHELIHIIQQITAKSKMILIKK